MNSSLRLLLVALALLHASAPLLAQTQEPVLQWSGFATLTAGRALGGAPADFAKCSGVCYVADWSHASVYGSGWQLQPESRAGVQATLVFSPALSATAQATVRADDAKAQLELAVLSYKFGNWDLQLGRKRIPLYFYSDFQDIGVAYPWVSPPPDLYGWEATNYNGVSLRYRGSVDGMGVSASAFAGSEHIHDAPIYQLYETQPVDIDWTRLFGGDLELSRDWWTLRLAYAQNNIREHYRAGDVTYAMRMKAYSVAFNADFGDWFVLTELGENARQYVDGLDTHYKVLSAMAAVGVRWGRWTPVFTVSRFHEHDASDDYAADRWNTYGFTLRYDLAPLQAVKLQLNRTQDTLGNFSRNTSALRLSYDIQF